MRGKEPKLWKYFQQIYSSESLKFNVLSPNNWWVPPRINTTCAPVLFDVWLRFITFGGRAAHLAYLVCTKVAIKYQSSSKKMANKHHLYYIFFHGILNNMIMELVYVFYIYIYIYICIYSQNPLIWQGLSHDNMSDKWECWNIKSVTYR